MSRVYAVEGSCFVLAPSCIITQEAVDELCGTADKKNLLHAGGGHSVIYGPDGASLTAKLPETEEGLLFAELDLGVISIAKNAADPVGHYARPDVTRLLLNPKRHRPVEYFSATGTPVQEAIEALPSPKRIDEDTTPGECETKADH